MIVRGDLRLRLAGRRAAPVPTTLASGIARLMVTGFFHDHEETEGLSVQQMLEAVMPGLAQVGLAPVRVTVDGQVTWTRTDADRPTLTGALPPVSERACGLVLDLAASDDAGATTAVVQMRARHPWGRPAVSVELLLVPLPPGASTADWQQGEAPAPQEARRSAQRLLADRASMRALAAQGLSRMKEHLEALQASFGTALPIARSATDSRVRLPGGLPGEAFAGIGPAPWAWLAAVSAEVAAGAADALGFPVEAMDGGGSFADPGPAADGGGALDAGPVDAPTDTGGGDLAP